MSIAVQGYSGCSVRVRPSIRNDPAENSVSHVVEKSTSKTAANARLLKQIDKQEAYARRLAEVSKDPRFPLVKVPKILFRRETQEGFASVGMAFEHHVDSVTFLSKAPVSEVAGFAAGLVQILQAHVELSEIQRVPANVILDKIEDISRVCQRNDVLAELNPRIAEVLKATCATLSPDACLELPVGVCHGDFTLSNVLVQKSSQVGVVLIDFLDNFVESPLADIAKLHQDLLFGWTLRQTHSGGQVDRTRVFMVLDRIRRQVEAAFAHELWYTKYFDLFLLLNQLRVLQYASCTDDAAYLMNSVEFLFRRMGPSRETP